VRFKASSWFRVCGMKEARSPLGIDGVSIRVDLMMCRFCTILPLLNASASLNGAAEWG
jgi:hypothetical protein